VVQNDRKTFQARIERLGRKGDLDGAIKASLEHLEKDVEDWNAILGLGELYFRSGNDDGAVASFTRVADHYHAEGFFPKATALYRKIIRIRPDDHAFLSLTELAAQQGRLVEAKEYLMALEKHRRAQGDEPGADECLASLDALIALKVAPPPSVPSDEMTRPTEEEEAAAIDEASTTLPSVSFELPAAPAGEEAVVATEPEALPSSRVPMPAARPARRSPARGRKPGSTGRKPVKPLQSVFNEMRARARETEDAAIAHERFDLAQYHLRDGNEAAAMTELREAAKAPVLRFAAAAQLGRLLAARSAFGEAVEWLERAAAVPPVTPDEGLAVLYELADSLERSGEPERALAVFIELQAQRRAYRDVAARIAALSARASGDPEA
jgi:tetratricopeptide (TPR) repeat protein